MPVLHLPRMSMPFHKSPRKFLWPLLAGFVVLMVGYFVALGTEIFDIAPEDYPEMRPVGKSGNSVRVEDVFAASQAFQKWKQADRAVMRKKLPETQDIERMLLGQESPDPAGMVAWFFRAHLALLAVEELSAQTSEWDGKLGGNSGNQNSPTRPSSSPSDLLQLYSEISVLSRVSISNREACLRSLRAESKLLRKTRECDQSMIWLAMRTVQERLIQLSVLQVMATAPWADNDELLAEFSYLVDLPEEDHVRHLGNALRATFKETIAYVKTQKAEARPEGPWKDWSANDWDERKERLSLWWTYYRLQPNRFARALRPYAADYLSQVRLPAKQRDLAESIPKATTIERILPWPEAGVACALGMESFYFFHPFFLQKGDETLATARLTQTAIALARYRLANSKRLPSTLAELVPRFLSSVPLDPFDGEPLRYNPEKQLLWSISKDLVDDHGGFSKRKSMQPPGVRFEGKGPDLVIELGILFGSRP